MAFYVSMDGSFNPFTDRNPNTMWRKVGGWTLRHSLLEPVFLPPAKPNLILLPPAKPNLPPCWRLISCSSPCFGGAKPEKKKPAAAAKTSRTEGAKVPRSKSAVAKYEKMNKVVSVDVWDSMSLADLGKIFNYSVQCWGSGFGSACFWASRIRILLFSEIMLAK
jgi:hypothetical protein